MTPEAKKQFKKQALDFAIKKRKYLHEEQEDIMSDAEIFVDGAEYGYSYNEEKLKIAIYDLKRISEMLGSTHEATGEQIDEYIQKAIAKIQDKK